LVSVTKRIKIKKPIKKYCNCDFRTPTLLRYEKISEIPVKKKKDKKYNKNIGYKIPVIGNNPQDSMITFFKTKGVKLKNKNIKPIP
jgi:hypothetical protein